MADKTFKQRVVALQQELKAPKNQYNSFGKYKYRNAEDILEAAKPLCAKHDVLLNITDKIEMIGSRVYVIANATLMDVHSDEMVTSQGWAQEPPQRKGMDLAQVTGASSSYARKYALNGLLAIDDTKDADNYDNREQTKQSTKAPSKQKAKAPAKQEPWQTKDDWSKFGAAQAEYQKASGLDKAAAWNEICTKFGNPKKLNKTDFYKLIDKVKTASKAVGVVAESFGEQPQLYSEDVNF